MSTAVGPIRHQAASVAGKEFAAAVAAAGSDDVMAHIESRPETLTRREQFARASGVAMWPDSMVSSRYTFIHDLYREVL